MIKTLRWLIFCAISTISVAQYSARYVNADGAAAAAPVQSVAGRSGNVTLTISDIGGAGSAASANATDFAASALASDPASVGAFSPANWKTALAYTIADVPGLQDALDDKASLSVDNEFLGNIAISQNGTLPSDTTNYALTIATSGSAVANFAAVANPYGNTDVSITESATGYRWVLAVYDDSPGIEAAGKFAFNAAGVGDAFELHRNLDAFFFGSLVVGADAAFLPLAKVCAVSAYSAAALFGYDEYTYTAITVLSDGTTEFSSTGSSTRYVFSGGPINQTPATKTGTSSGEAGDIAWDANYIYICTGDNVWKRVSLTSF